MKLTNHTKVFISYFKHYLKTSCNYTLFKLHSPIIKKKLFGNKKYHRNKVLMGVVEGVRKKHLERKYAFEKRYPTEVLSSRDSITQKNKVKFLLLRYLYYNQIQKLFTKNKFKIVEIYFQGNSKEYLPQLIIYQFAKWSNAKIVIILRGELYYYNSITRFNKKALAKILNGSDLILYRELYMKEILDKIGVNSQKIIHDYNKVNIKHLKPKSYNKNILFYNSFKKWRRIDLVIKGFYLYWIKNPESKLFMYGARNDSEIKLAKTIIKNLKNKNVVSSIYLKKFEVNCNKIFEKCSIFILPSNLVYLNNSLLEAMERGLVPIVTDIEESKKIINHQINGLLTKQNEKNICENLSYALSDKNRMALLSKESRNTVIKDYSNENRLDVIWQMVNS